MTYSWNKFRFFKDIIFHISQRCLHIPVVLVLDILRTLNKLHSAGSETSFSGKHGSSAIRNNLLVEYWTVMKLWEFVLTLDAYFNTPLNINERFGFKLSLHSRGLEEIASIKVNISIIFWGRLNFIRSHSCISANIVNKKIFFCQGSSFSSFGYSTSHLPLSYLVPSILLYHSSAGPLSLNPWISCVQHPFSSICTIASLHMSNTSQPCLFLSPQISTWMFAPIY